MENGFYKVKDNGEWTVAMRGDNGWYLPGCEYTMEEAGYDPLEEIGERIVLPDESSDERPIGNYIIPDVNVAVAVKQILQPKYMNDIYTWKEVRDAIIKATDR